MIARIIVPLRRGVQALSLVVILLLPLIALYNHYHAARAISDLPEKQWRTTALQSIEKIVGESDWREKAIDQTQGTLWSAKLLGVSLSDPLAGVEAIAGSRTFYRPLLLSLVIPLGLTLLLGRVFCGWICPMNTLLEIVDKCRGLLKWAEIRQRDVQFSLRNKYIMLLSALGMVAFTGRPFLALVYPPAVISRELHLSIFGAGLGIGIYFILVICAFELLVSRRWWCRYVCPGGAIYSLLGRFRLLRIRRNVEKCVECGDCVRVCQFDLRPMLVSTTGMECTNCASCISSCDSNALSYSIVLPGLGPKKQIPPLEKRTVTPTAIINPPLESAHEEALETTSIRQKCVNTTLGILLLLLLFPTSTQAHHILGLPHYSYKENYPQAPTLEYPAKTGPYDVLMTSYPGRPVPGDAGIICFYIKDRNTQVPYQLPVTVRVLQTSTFGSSRTIVESTTHRPFDNQHKYTVTFPEESEYIIELTMQVEGKDEVIPFLMVIGNPTATKSIVVAIVAGLGMFLIAVRAIKKKLQRQRQQAKATFHASNLSQLHL